MAPEITLRVRATQDGAHLYHLLLRATRDHPEAFAAEYETGLSTSIDDFVTGIFGPMTADWMILGAFADQPLVGMLELRRNVRAKFRHIVTFGTMYVAPQARSQGTGRALMQASSRVASRPAAVTTSSNT